MEEFINSLESHHLIFLFSVVFIFVFRSPLSALISRITSIDKSGVKAGSEPDVQREERNREAVQELLMSIGESIVLSDIEGRIRTELVEKGLETEGDTIIVLIKHLAASRILTEFEQIYNLIFGSQIFLLKKLNEVAGQGKSEEYIRDYFERVKKLYTDELAEWSIEQYFEFLYARALIINQNGSVHITNLGVEFITWMARNGKSDDKGL